MQINTNDEIKTLAEICSTLENFVRFVLNARPTNQQLQIIRAVDKGKKRIAVKSGHGTGKSTTLSWLAIWWGLFKLDAKIPVTAPSSPQLMATLMPEMRKWIDKLPQIFKD